MDRTELAWAAGFWDGEGSAYLTGALDRATRQPQARLNQSSMTGVPEVLTRFCAAIGFGKIAGPVIEEGREPLYWWVVSSRREIEATYRALHPWLGVVKRRQFETLLDESAPSSAPITDGDQGLAWAAGLFDGEGSVYLDPHSTHAGYFRLEAAITQTAFGEIPMVLSRFMYVAGIGKIYGPYPAPPGHAPVYRWKAHQAGQIIAMINALDPWLGSVKRDQAARAIGVVAAQSPLPRGNPAWGNRKTYCVRGHEYATARIRAFRGRGRNIEAPRESKQCLACVREYARSQRLRQREKPRSRRGFGDE